jgi:NAD/NADP transhydrogenase beta subunit
MRDQLVNLAYLVASILFILCLRGLSSPEQGRRGIFLGELGMLVAVVATLIKTDIVRYDFIVAGLLIGSTIGIAISARLPMTKMPERIAFSHAFGGLATSLVGVAEYLRIHEHVAHDAAKDAAGAALPAISRLEIGALGFEVFLGALTFTGSIMAFGKLQGVISGAPITWKGQNVMNIGAFFGAIALLVYQIRLLAREGQTWGKKQMKVRIVLYETGEIPGLGRSLGLRMFVNNLIGAIPCVGGIYSIVDILFIFGEERRCVHDFIAGTKVVEAI